MRPIKKEFTLSEQRFLMSSFIETLIFGGMYRNYGITVRTDVKWKSSCNSKLKKQK